jgi:hypothetical protein
MQLMKHGDVVEWRLYIWGDRVTPKMISCIIPSLELIVLVEDCLPCVEVRSVAARLQVKTRLAGGKELVG